MPLTLRQLPKSAFAEVCFCRSLLLPKSAFAFREIKRALRGRARARPLEHLFPLVVHDFYTLYTIQTTTKCALHEPHNTPFF